MTSPIADAELEDKPLSPEVERVRRRLVRFAVINLLILFVALAAVVAALLWRTGSRGEGGGFVEAPLALPAGAETLSHTVTDRAISLLVRLPDGGSVVLVFSRANGALLGRYPLTPSP